MNDVKKMKDIMIIFSDNLCFIFSFSFSSDKYFLPKFEKKSNLNMGNINFTQVKSWAQIITIRVIMIPFKIKSLWSLLFNPYYHIFYIYCSSYHILNTSCWLQEILTFLRIGGLWGQIPANSLQRLWSCFP